MNKYVFEYKSAASGVDDCEIVTIFGVSIFEAQREFERLVGTDSIEVVNVRVFSNYDVDD
ncbi:MAG: hypothetical protein CMF12_08660 [Idiomarina sp.]|uniref:hypothetical protein n=1 Tax=Idiomarina sp. TaxID=1874361 RepID=UPI000C40F074|nr:hypothetical protein [Idiomarina sp.]MBT42581.1 hypothetical protein [Idiomarina sp.]